MAQENVILEIKDEQEMVLPFGPMSRDRFVMSGSALKGKGELSYWQKLVC